MRKKTGVFVTSWFFLLFVSISSYAATQGIDHTKKEIKIGWFGPLSGVFQKIGEGMLDGMKAFIDRRNSHGGVGGYKVLLISYDNNNDPILSQQVLKKLMLQDKVFSIVGALGSNGINAVISDMEKYSIPVVYLGGGETHWAIPPKRNIFPVQPDYITEGRFMVKFAIENLNARRLAFIYRNDNTGRTALTGVKNAMNIYGRKFGAGLVLEAKRDSVEVIIAKLKTANPDAVLVFDFFGGATGIVSASKRAGINTNWVTSYVNSDNMLYKMTGKAWLGVYIAGWGKPTGNSTTDFLKYYTTTRYHKKALERRWDSPSGYNIAGWIACEIFYGGLDLFLKKHKTVLKLDWDNFIRAMETMKNFNNTMAKDITYYPFSLAKPGTKYYYLARSGQRTLYFSVASLTSQGQFYLKPITQWLY